MGARTRLDDIRAAIEERLAELRDEEAHLMAARAALTSGTHTRRAAPTEVQHERPRSQASAETDSRDSAGDRALGDGDAEPGNAPAARAPTVAPRATTCLPEREPRLTIELVPPTCWEINVRNAVPHRVWDRLRRRVYAEAGNRCEVCGGRGVRPALHCHEVWEYDDEHHVQRFARMAALCPPCHEVKHIGRTNAVGYGSHALRRLARINEWTPEQAGLYALAAFEKLRERATHEWELDLDGLRAYGVDPAIVERTCTEQRAERQRARAERDAATRRPTTASVRFDPETGAGFWLCDHCGQRGDAIYKTPDATDEAAIQDLRRWLHGRFNRRFDGPVDLIREPPGWKRHGGRLLCGSCAGTDPSC